MDKPMNVLLQPTPVLLSTRRQSARRPAPFEEARSTRHEAIEVLGR